MFSPQPPTQATMDWARREGRRAAACAGQLTGDPAAPLVPVRVRLSDSSRLPRAGTPFIIHWRHVAWRPRRWGRPAGRELVDCASNGARHRLGFLCTWLRHALDLQFWLQIEVATLENSSFLCSNYCRFSVLPW